MGDRFNSFIQSLTDHELAIYVRYQREGLLDYAKEIVNNELSIRQLTIKQLDKYLIDGLPHYVHEPFCKQCGSNRLFQDKDIEYVNSDYFTSEIEVSTNRCRICNFNPSKAPKNLIDRIKLFFKGDPDKSEETIKRYDWFGK